MKLDPEEIQEIIQMAKSFSPLAEDISEVIVNDYGPALGKLMESIRNFQVQGTHKSIEQYKKLGYGKKDAILLTLNNKMALAEVLQSFDTSKNKK